jgi:hypothetical protein
VRRALARLPEEERREIVLEIRSHILDRCEGGSGVPFEDVERELGASEDLARRFRDSYEVSAALATGSGRRMLGAAGLILGRSVRTFAGFLLFLILYSVSLTFAAIGVMKPIFPERVGLWTANGSLYSVGFVDPQPGLTEHLGYWLVPLSLAAATVVYWLSTGLLRRYLASVKRRGGPLDAGGELS